VLTTFELVIFEHRDGRSTFAEATVKAVGRKFCTPPLKAIRSMLDQPM
jgi:hypothetical protein